jgi:hypothetical protein
MSTASLVMWIIGVGALVLLVALLWLAFGPVP